MLIFFGIFKLQKYYKSFSRGKNDKIRTPINFIFYFVIRTKVVVKFRIFNIH